MSSSRVVLLAVVTAIWLTSGIAAGASVELQGLRTAVHADATTFLLRIEAPVRYIPTWIDSRTYALDLAGVSTQLVSASQPVRSPLVGSYRVFTYEGTDGTPHVRLELNLKSEAKVDVQQGRDGVTLQVRAGSAPSSTPGSAQGGSPSSPPDPKESPATPAVPLNPKRGTAIRAVQVAKLEGTSTLEVQIAGDGALQYRSMRLTNPERVVVDIPNAENRIRQKQLSVNAPPLRSVRIGQLSQKPLVSRVVMDLDSKTPYEVRSETSSLVVSLGSSSAKAETPEKKIPAAELAPELAPEKLAGAKTTPASSAATNSPAAPQKPAKDQPTVAKSGVSEPSELKEQHPAAASATPKTTVPPENAKKTPAAPARTQWKAVPNTASPAKRPAAPPSAPATSAEAAMSAPVHLAALSEPSQPTAVIPSKLEGALTAAPKAAPSSSAAVAPSAATGKKPTPEKATQTEKEFQKEAPGLQPDPTGLLAQQTPPAAPTPQTPAQAAAPKAYSGEPISVNLKDVDLKDFFRLIHEISGLNVVLDPTVSGNVTIVLDEVPWDQAMEIVMRNNQLGKEVEGNVVRIARLSTLEAEEKQRGDLALAVEQSQPKTTVTRTLNYAKAADLIPTLKKFLTARGDLVPDVRTNTIIITDIPASIPTIDRLIRSLDQKSLQVEIEARVVSASRSFARDIGTQLAASGLTGNVILGGTGIVGASPILRGTPPPLFVGTPPTAPTPGSPPIFANVAQPLNTNFPAQGANSGFSLSLSGGNSLALDAIITAAESRGVGKLLSRPKIITQNNVEAVVQQGVKIPIQTTVNNTVSVQYVNVVLRLTVTPQITAEGTIFLKTDIENTSIDPGIATIPGQFGLDTQSATTQVLVSNGGTVFFGGVVQNINRVSQQQVPLLGSVPLLGNLFKRKLTSSTTNELLFFITPRIVQS